MGVTRCGTTRDPSSTRKPLPQVTSSGKLIGSREPLLRRSQSRSRWLQASLQVNQRQQSKHIDPLALEEPSPLSNFTIHQKFPHYESKSVKVMGFSVDGQMVA